MHRAVEDHSEDLSGIAGILRSNLGLESSINDRRIVQEMCSLVGQRAARLAAAGVAAVMAQMRTDGTGVSVGIDGSVFKKFPHFDEVSVVFPIYNHTRDRSMFICIICSGCVRH
jgi:hexokinase